MTKNGGSVVSSDYSQRFQKSFKMKKGKSFVGSPFYISPEILLGREANFASDLWSLGIIIYEMFTGKTPFDKKSALKTQSQIKSCEYEKLKASILIPEEAADLVNRLLQFNPYDRIGA
jgi:serine/threonine protein kinase